MNSDIKEQDLMIRLLTALWPEVKIYLFGSRARGTHTEISDIDLALDIGRKMTIQELYRAKNILECLNIPQTIDVVDMNRINEDMKNIILREKVVWKS